MRRIALRVKKTTKKLKVLDFDIETRLVGFHEAGRFAPKGCEPVAISVSWVGQNHIQSVAIRHYSEIVPMLDWFMSFYHEADIVTGHYIKKFDLPILNGAMMEWGLQPLGPKLTIDTKLDLAKMAGFSQSQENLSAMFRLEEGKLRMSDVDWRAVSRLEPDAMEKLELRNRGDVIQHKALRERLAKEGRQKPPKLWNP